MQWSPQQDAALKSFSNWFKNRGSEQVYHLFGYAGTGKSSLALELSQNIKGNVLYAAFTGKAASVMRKKGCSGAQTLHSLLYNVKQASKKRLIEIEVELSRLTHEEDAGVRADLEKERDELRKRAQQPSWDLNPYSPLREAALLVVDEVSMVGSDIGEDILSFNKPVLVLGDPAQLPPVKGTGFFDTESPEVMLTEVHRMALDNPVLALATRVRNGDRIVVGDYGDSRVVSRDRLAGGESIEHDQVLVGRNATRNAANKAMRARLGFTGDWPMAGEKLVCLRNNREKGLLNGTLWRANSAEYDGAFLELNVSPEEGGEGVATQAFPEPFLGLETPRWGARDIDEFTFGYALTTHKAQGSEWESVYIVDESSIARGDAHRWLYTALTRASQRVTLVR
jgi:exodeoxyribonuclease-5